MFSDVQLLNDFRSIAAKFGCLVFSEGNGEFVCCSLLKAELCFCMQEIDFIYNLFCFSQIVKDGDTYKVYFEV